LGTEANTYAAGRALENFWSLDRFMTQNSGMVSATSTKGSNLLTVVAVALLAYAIDDIVHEVLGHGTACLLLGVKMLGLSTIGLQTETSSRLVASAGAIANVTVGALALSAVARDRAFGGARYFIWLLGFVNLMNGTGYLIASAVTNSDDCAVVIAHREPTSLWRFAMGLVGALMFAASVIWAKGTMRAWVAAGDVAAADVPRLTGVPYLAGGLMYVLASLFNPVGTPGGRTVASLGHLEPNAAQERKAPPASLMNHRNPP